METAAVVEMDEAFVGAADDEYVVVDADAAAADGNREEEIEEERAVAMEDDGGQEAPAGIAEGTVMVVEVAVIESKGKDRRESGGRRKRKERESGGGHAEDGETKEERKKRRDDEKERRKGRGVGDGSEKRVHREGRDRKESKRKKDRKERREEREEKSRKDRVLVEEVEGWEQFDRRGRDGRSEKKDRESHRRERRDHDAVVDREARVSRSSPRTMDETFVLNSSGVDGRKFASTLESIVKPVVVDDDKEEGEIRDDDSGPVGVVSEAESGEIQTQVDTTVTSDDRDEVPVSVRNSPGIIGRSRWASPPAETSNILSEHSTLDLNGAILSKGALEKSGQVATPNPLQSMLVIAEAYDSESQASEEKNGLLSVVKAESRRHYNRKSENGSRRSEVSESDRKAGLGKAKGEDKADLKSQSMGPPEQPNGERKDRKVVNAEDESRSRLEDKKVRSSHRIEARVGTDSEREDVKEPPILDMPEGKVTLHLDSPDREDSGQAGGTRGNDSRRLRSPSPKETTRDKDQRTGRSRSKDGRAERGRSRSLESTKGRDFSRRRSRSPELARQRSSIKVRSPSRESLRDRRTVAVESLERRKRSRSGDSGPDHRRSRDKTESYDRRRRSRSRESGRLRAPGRGDSVDRRQRSRSRDSLRDKKRDITRRTDSAERRRRSRSRSVRDRRVADRVSSRLLDGLERRHRSRSKESSRDHKLDDRDNSRHGRRGDDSRLRNSRDDRSSRDGRHYEGSRDNMYRTDRDRDRIYNNSHDRKRSNKDSLDKDSHQSARDSTAAEATREEENQEEYQERVASQLAAQEEDDVERVKEESRKRRQAILDKYKKQQGELANGQPSSTETGHSANGVMAEVDVAPLVSLASKHLSPILMSAPSDVSLSLGKASPPNGALFLQASKEGGLGAGTPKSERSADMFCDDIFGESPAGGRRLGRGDGLAMDTSGLIDNWDDAEGYYCFRIGEVLDGRYEVASSHGRGVFSTVVRARDMKAGSAEPEEVAIKIIRNNETMYKAGLQELVILKKLAGADPENKKHCVRLLSSFEYRSHLCLVFESLHMNLREILKKFGRNIGINLNAVRAYAKQLFISLKHLRNCGVLHCDIKPDNMLVNESKNVLKLCDFGSAMFAGENEITPYLVSRFYRAPEIILGLNYDHALDIWSVGCCLYELFTGKMLFPGHTNNDMLRLHMELKGPFPKKMLKKAAFADQHFDQDFNFCAIEEDPVTKKAIKRILVNVKPRDVGILVTGSGTADEDSKLLASFKDLLEKIFILDPDKRLTVSQALSHSFISGK